MILIDFILHAHIIITRAPFDRRTGNGGPLHRGANLNGCVGYATGMSYIWEWSYTNLGPTEGRTN